MRLDVLFTVCDCSLTLTIRNYLADVSAGSVSAELDEGAEHLVVRIMGISSARVREQKHGSVGKPSRRRPKLGKFSPLRAREEHAINRYSKEGDSSGSIALDLMLQRGDSSPIFLGGQFAHSDGASADDVGQAEAPFGKPPILLIGQLLIDEARLKEKFPKAVGGPGKMVADGGRPQSGIDPDEQDPGSGRQAVDKRRGPNGYSGHGVYRRS